MRLERRIQLIAAGVLIACLGGSAVLSAAVAAESGRAQLGYGERAEESDPPEVAAAIALGAFRGLFVNILWFRAEKMKQAGKFHEAIELARTITRLQPRFPRVWGFHAWNMAYNISVATNTASERWQWVQSGIRLLRDEGIPKNPSDVQLHKELAWIFVHKIQGINDDANHYYKRELAREWTYILGPPPPRGATLEESIQNSVDRLQAIVDAPATLEELLTVEPALSEVVARVRDEAKLPLDMEFLRRVEMARALARTRFEEGVPVEFAADARNDAFDAILADVLSEEAKMYAFARLVNHVRKRVLIDEYHMEPERMIRYTREFGPLDWRHAASHGLYWANRGIEMGAQRLNRQDFDEVNTNRLLTHAAQELFRWGTIYFNPINDTYVQMMDLDYAEVYLKVYREYIIPRAIERSKIRDVEAEDPNRPYRVAATGYENFLRDLIRISYRMGDIERAEEYYHELRTTQDKNTNAPVHQKRELSLTLREFIEQDLKERITSPDYAQTEILAALTNAYFNGLLRGDMKVFQSNMTFANEVHKRYMVEQNRRTMADASQNRMQFMSPYFAEVAAGALVMALDGANVGLWQRSRMFRMLSGSEWRPVAQAAFEIMEVTMKPYVEDFASWFPEPPGMEEHRQRRASLEGQSDATRKEQVQIEQK